MSIWVRAGVTFTLILGATGARATQFVPPAGYSGNPAIPGVPSPSEPGTPALTRVPNDKLADRFRVHSAYQRDGIRAHVEVVGAFELAESKDERLVAAWAPAFLPVGLAFSDGRCFSLSADYENGTLSNGRLSKVSCEDRRTFELPQPPKPSDPLLRLISSSWGYGAWANPRSNTTIVTAPYAKTFQPLFTARMKVNAIMAMNSPDAPLGNVTLVGRMGGRLMVVTLLVQW